MEEVNVLRSYPDLSMDVSIRTSLMIGEMVAAGASLREEIVTSLQTNKETLEGILTALHPEKGYLRKGIWSIFFLRGSYFRTERSFRPARCGFY